MPSFLPASLRGATSATTPDLNAAVSALGRVPPARPAQAGSRP